MKLVETRCRSHPFLLDGLRRLQEYTDDMEKLNPSSKKSAFFYTGYESLSRSEVQRHKEKLENITPKNKNLIILPSTSKPYSKHANKEYIKKYTPKIPTFYSKTTNTDYTESDIVIADIPFGIIPLGLDEFYPLAQNESPTNTDENSKKYIQQAIIEYSQKYENILIHRKVVGKYDLTDYKLIEEELKLPEAKLTDFDRLKEIADYQFGKGSGDALFGDNPEKIKIEKSKKTGKIRHVYQDDDIIVNMRANDGFLILSDLGAIRLHKHLPSPNLRVVVSEDSEPYALKGKSVFNKFVIDCDEKIRRNDEVLIVNKDDKLLACGKSLLSSYEIKDFNTGQAIKTRKIKKLTG